jgi:hypothetical protein
MRARFAAAILSLALVYAATCSATCAICLGSSAGSAAETQSHSCEHAAPDAAGGAQKKCPAKPGCFAHHHSGFEFVQCHGLSGFQPRGIGGASQLFGGAVRREAAVEVAPFRSDLAPPRDATIFPQPKISILRI